MRENLLKKDNSITVLMSVFNGEKWLSECIESILNQTIKEFQFLIINDGSTDNTLRIIKSFQEVDQRIKCINQENIGLTKSLNKGLKIAKSKWIARFDSDDISIETRLEDQLNFANQFNLDLVGSRAKLISSEGEFIGNINCPIVKRKIIRNLYKQGIIFPHSSAFFSLEKVISIGGYREQFNRSQDYDLWLRMSENFSIGCLEKKCVFIRIHNKRITNKEYGINQRLMAHCGLVSHFIRVKNWNKTDEFIFLNEYNFDKFRNFVFKELEKFFFIEFYRKLFLLKQDYNFIVSNNNFLRKYIAFLFLFCSPKMIFKLIHWKIFGDRISKKIAFNWHNFLISNEQN